MDLFVFSDIDQILVEGVGGPGINEVLMSEIGKSLTVKGFFKIVKRDCMIEDLNIV
ncbi:hypothetical protein GJ744_008848 [Endocarpon pusillum]|uniref:Uncharacterized protein n=1 Tax=Endocarpon pusillum TaxID=364733 RepID=A0A8H7ASI0_9EURO|nr:hypothetical protein GJ744_008848 [Endocarpon pusillum]